MAASLKAFSFTYSRSSSASTSSSSSGFYVPQRDSSVLDSLGLPSSQDRRPSNHHPLVICFSSKSCNAQFSCSHFLGVWYRWSQWKLALLHHGSNNIEVMSITLNEFWVLHHRSNQSLAALAWDYRQLRHYPLHHLQDFHFHLLQPASPCITLPLAVASK